VIGTSLPPAIPLPANLARAVLTREGKARGRLRIALFVHRKLPPRHPDIRSFHAEVPDIQPT
jgi:hypothetical protein